MIIIIIIITIIVIIIIIIIIIVVIIITIIITIMITVNVISYAPFVRVFGWKVEKHIFFILSLNFFLFFREKIVLSAE